MGLRHMGLTPIRGGGDIGLDAGRGLTAKKYGKNKKKKGRKKRKDRRESDKLPRSGKQPFNTPPTPSRREKAAADKAESEYRDHFDDSGRPLD